MLIANVADNNSALVEGLKSETKSETQALKIRCNALKRTIRDLQLICDMHWGYLETFRQHIARLQERSGMLDLTYQGEQLELML